MKVLLLAGTTQARQFAEIAHERAGIEVIASFAGHTREQRTMPCTVRVGGFGGADGLTAYVRDNNVDAIVDATHPFSTAMPKHALAAARATGTAHARVARPQWSPTAGDNWIDADDLDDAARLVHRLGCSPVLLTIGRLDMASFAGLEPVAFVVRTVEDPRPLPFEARAVIEARGPFAVEEEARLLAAHGIELLVTKNAGGDNAKLVAARGARLPVVMVRRPPISGEHSFTNASDTLAWLASLTSLAT
jgi:precorrin-6A/cobalt-precorrin-6A reductase